MCLFTSKPNMPFHKLFLSVRSRNVETFQACQNQCNKNVYELDLPELQQVNVLNA